MTITKVTTERHVITASPSEMGAVDAYVQRYGLRVVSTTMHAGVNTIVAEREIGRDE